MLRQSEQSDTQTSHRLYAHLKLPWIICAGWSEVSSVLALQQCLDRIYESLVQRVFFSFRLLIVIMGQLNSSLLPTVTHAIKPSPLIFFFFFLPTMPVNTQMEAHIHASYLQGGKGERKKTTTLCIVTCLHRAHTMRLFETTAVSTKSFKFPFRA